MAGPAVRPLGIGEEAAAIALIKASFTGYYRWHAKRTLGEVGRLRAVSLGSDLVGLAMLDRLEPEVGYVYYLMVAPAHRRQGIGRLLLEDALAHYRSVGVEVVYAAVEAENLSSLRLFEAFGFRPTERKERSYKDGGLGAWGLRSRMRVVRGELLLGLRLKGPDASVPGPSPTSSVEAPR